VFLRHATQSLFYFPHSAIYFIILSLSVQISHVFINHVLKFKYRPICLKVNVHNVLRVIGYSTVVVCYHDTDSYLGNFAKF